MDPSGAISLISQVLVTVHRLIKAWEASSEQFDLFITAATTLKSSVAEFDRFQNTLMPRQRYLLGNSGNEWMASCTKVLSSMESFGAKFAERAGKHKEEGSFATGVLAHFERLTWDNAKATQLTVRLLVQVSRFTEIAANILLRIKLVEGIYVVSKFH